MNEPPNLDDRIRDRLARMERFGATVAESCPYDGCERRQLVAAVECVLDQHVPTLDDSSEVDEPYWYCELCWRGACRCDCGDRQDALYPCQPVRDIAHELDIDIRGDGDDC